MRLLTRVNLLSKIVIFTTSCTFGSISIDKRALLAADPTMMATISKNPEGVQVHSIKIELVSDGALDVGTEGVEAARKNLKTHEREPFSQVQFDQDLKVLAKEFDRVEPSVQVVGNDVDLVIKVWRKPLIMSILFEGNKAFDSKKLMKESGCQEKILLDRQELYKNIQKIRAYYMKKGYFEVQVTPEIIDRGTGTVDVKILIQEGRAGFIDSIRFHNISKKEKEDITDRMLTKKYNFFLSWLTDQGTYSQDMFRQDEMMIVSYIQNEGFLDAKVTTKIAPSKKNENRIVIDITVHKGERYFLGAVTFNMQKNIFTEKQLLEKSGLKPSTPYSPDSIRIAAKRIYDSYGSKGHIDTMVIPEPKLVSQKDRTYDVSFRIEQGACFRVGLIRIIGNNKTDASVILHETPLIPGNTFDSTMLAKTEERLRNIGYFKSVNVYAVKSDQNSTETVPLRDIHIEVDELPTTAQFSAFGGYNTTESIAGGFNLSENNFKMEGIPYVFSKGLRSLRGGGEYMGFNAVIGAKQQSYTLSWTKPYFLDSKWALGVDLQKMDNSFAASDYTIKSKQILLSLKRPLNAFLSVGTQYRLHDAEIDLHGIKNIRRNRELIRESKNGGMISAVGVSLNYDSTNHPVSPRTGLRSSLSMEYAGIFGDHYFLNLGYLNTFFIPVEEHGILKVKANFQGIETMFGTQAKHIPMDERLYLGGEGTIRGYRYNTVGPAFNDVRHTPRGGLTSVLFSGEYEHRLFKRLGGFVFADAGNVWWKSLHVDAKLRYSTGFGIKFYITENAPLTIGYSVALNPNRGSNTQRFYFSIGATF